MSFGYDTMSEIALCNFCSHIIQREASALLFLLQWAMREPLSVGRAAGTGFHAFFINQSVQSGEPIGHDGIIMEQNKKGELQSRREFFKRAAKGALPILGAIALANMPLLASASESSSTSCSGCNNRCMNSCFNTCHGSCNRHCADNCSSNCRGTCSNSCARVSK